jgi:hypothetical protein
LDQTLEALPAPRRALAIRLFRHLVTATGGKHAWRADDLANEIDADRSAARQAAERTLLGSIGGRIDRVLVRLDAAVRSLFGGPCCTDRSLGREVWRVYQGPIS